MSKMKYIAKTKDELKKEIEKNLDGVKIHFCKYEKIPIPQDNDGLLWSFQRFPTRAYENKIVRVETSEEAEGFILGGQEKEYNIFEGLRENKKGKLEQCYYTFIFPETGD